MAQSTSVIDFVESLIRKADWHKELFFSRTTISLEWRRSLLLSYRKELILKPVVKCNQ